MRTSGAFAVAVLVTLFAQLGHSASPPPSFVVYAEASGHMRLGLPVLNVGRVDGGSGIPEAGIGVVNFDEVPFSVNDCQRDLRLRLEYEPRNASAGVPGLHLAIPFHFQVQLLDNATGEPLPEATFEFTRPGTASYLLDEARDLRAGIRLERGAEVDWSLRASAFVDPGADCAWAGLLFINEVEANPAGRDADRERVELWNAGFREADLAGWKLKALHGVSQTHVFPEGTLLEAGARLVVAFDGQFVDNEDEVVVLEAASGAEVDRTPPLNDTANDDRSWQRVPDGADEWAFATSTLGAANADGSGTAGTTQSRAGSADVGGGEERQDPERQRERVGRHG